MADGRPSGAGGDTNGCAASMLISRMAQPDDFG